jgi:hypothetical protein
MEGFEVITSDGSSYGQVVGVRGGNLIVEHGTLRKSRHAVPETFAETNEHEQTVRLSVSKEIVDTSPKLAGDSIDEQAVAEHYGLAQATAAPQTEGYGESLPDDPARSADEEALAAGREPADQERASMRESGFGSEREEDLGSSPGLLGDRLKQ